MYYFIEGEDYVSLQRTILLSGRIFSTDCVDLQILDDTLMEGDEVFTVALQPQVPVHNTDFMEILVTVADTDLGELLK